MIRVPKVYRLTLPPGSTYADGYAINLERPAVYLQISNEGESLLRVRLNGDDEAVLELQAGEGQSFDPGDVDVTQLQFGNPENQQGKAQVVLSLRVD